MVELVFQKTLDYLNKMPKVQRKAYGQFFTCPETAKFMAGLFTIPQKESISILDPGAGTGLLTIALLERIEHESHIKNITITCYENDSNILTLLKDNLCLISSLSEKNITYNIIARNYILHQSVDYNTGVDKEKADLIIGNPPYLKIGKEAPEAKAMLDVCRGAPNLYFLFATMSLFNLKYMGEMVYIVPRSWTSGTYFAAFRNKFLKQGALTYIHLFTARNKVFYHENILQETIIIKVVKSEKKPKNITISTSNNHSDFLNKTTIEVPYNHVVQGLDNYVYLMTNKIEVQAISKLKTFTNTLPSLGLRMKTGITVDFRYKESLRDTPFDDCIPLFSPHHIKNGEIDFPLRQKYEYLLTDQKSLKQPNSNYLFVKRFTSKEEYRRLQCAIYLSKNFSEYREISTHNKINFICGVAPLSKAIVYGLYVLFNSTLYDIYYRVLNGSTQVNATEINNAFPMPTLDIIEYMGNKLMRKKGLTVKLCDSILESCLSRK